MKTRTLISTVTMAACMGWIGAGVGSAADEEGQWKSLFNGENLDGWVQINGTADYEVEDGAIVGTTEEGSPNSFLCTEEHFSDFVLEFEVRLDDNQLNSGVQFRSNSTEDYQNGRVHGYQVEIEAAPGEAGYIYDEARRGWLSEDREENQDAFKNGEWNHYRVRCEGDHIQTWVNGTPIADLRDDMTESGFIGLQVHGVQGDPDWQVRWRNIRIKKLNDGE